MTFIVSGHLKVQYEILNINIAAHRYSLYKDIDKDSSKQDKQVTTAPAIADISDETSGHFPAVLVAEQSDTRTTKPDIFHETFQRFPTTFAATSWYFWRDNRTVFYPC